MRDNKRKKNSGTVMTAQDVSSYLKIPLTTLYGLTKQGKIPAVKVGKHWRYLREDVERYLNGEAGRGTPLPQDKRNHPRINCELTASVQVLLDQRKELRVGLLQNISQGGAEFIFSKNNTQMRAGDPVRVSFEIKNDRMHVFEVEGRVAHRAQDSINVVGIKFRDLPEEAKEVIEAYVG